MSQIFSNIFGQPFHPYRDVFGSDWATRSRITLRKGPPEYHCQHHRRHSNVDQHPHTASNRGFRFWMWTWQEDRVIDPLRCAPTPSSYSWYDGSGLFTSQIDWPDLIGGPWILGNHIYSQGIGSRWHVLISRKQVACSCCDFEDIWRLRSREDRLSRTPGRLYTAFDFDYNEGILKKFLMVAVLQQKKIEYFLKLLGLFDKNLYRTE